jgi:hypothetical protein
MNNSLEPNREYVPYISYKKSNTGDYNVESFLDEEFMKINDFVWDEVIDRIKRPIIRIPSEHRCSNIKIK